jgi:hypothetical protein
MSSKPDARTNGSYERFAKVVGPLSVYHRWVKIGRAWMLTHPSASAMPTQKQTARPCKYLIK